MKQTKENKDKIIKTLYEELERKNLQIKKLKEENIILMKAALKRAEDTIKKKEKKKTNHDI